MYGPGPGLGTVPEINLWSRPGPDRNFFSPDHWPLLSINSKLIDL